MITSRRGDLDLFRSGGNTATALLDLVVSLSANEMPYRPCPLQYPCKPDIGAGHPTNQRA